MPERRNLAAVLLVLGLGLMGLSRLVAGAATAPLFDGLVVEEPYRFVEPAPSGVGNPLAASAVELVVQGAVPLVAVATEETPPQAQMIAQADAFAIAEGTKSIAVSIQPNPPTDPRIAGNVYRFAVTDQAGTPLEIVPGALVSIVLRGPEPNADAMVAHLEEGQWVTLPTQHGGLPDLFAANVGQLGDFAVLIPGAAPGASGGAPSPTASRASGGAKGESGIPAWVIALFAIAAVGVGLTRGLVGGGEDDR